MAFEVRSVRHRLSRCRPLGEKSLSALLFLQLELQLLLSELVL